MSTINEQFQAALESAQQDPAFPAEETLDTATDSAQTTETQEPSPAPAAEPQPAGSDFDPSQWKLNYRGKEFVPRDRDHIINLAQQGFSYSERMAALKQQEESLKGKYTQYEQFDSLISSNPALAEQIVKTITEYATQTGQTAQQAATQMGAPALPPEVLREINDLRGFRDEYVTSKANDQVSQEIQSLQNKYKIDWNADDGQGSILEQVLRHALEKGDELKTTIPLETAFRDLMYDRQLVQVKADALKEAAANRQKAVRAGVIPQGAAPASQPQTIGYRKGMSLDDVSKQALAFLTQSQ
jgi:hypothetical protein